MISRITCLLAVSLVWGGVALAKPPKPTKFLKKEVSAVRALLATPVKKGTPEAAEMDRKLMARIEPVMEFETLSQRALRKHWPSLDAAQRAAFISTFKDLVFNSYLSRVRGANEGYTVEYEGEEGKGDRAVISTVAKTRKVEIELVFHLEAREGKRWVVGDIVIDEVSLVENYREQFNKIITKDGFPALLEKMKKKLAEFKT